MLYGFTLLFFVFLLLQFCLKFNLLSFWRLRVSFFSSLERYVFFLSLIIIFFSILGFSLSYFPDGNDFLRFIIIFTSFALSIVLLIFHDSVFMLFVAWDGLGVSSFYLVAYYMNWSSSNGALVTVLTNRFGDFCLFWFFSSLVFSSFLYSFIFPLIFILGAFTKRAQFPFSNWLPLAIAAPTPVSSLVHRRTLVTAGVYIIFRYFFLFEQFIFLEFMFLISLFTIFVAGLRSLSETDFKKIIALRTLSQMGFLILALRFCLTQLSFFHLLTHAFFKRCLFIQVGGMILKSFGRQESRIFSGFIQRRPVLCFISLVCCISLCGQIFSSGFFRKENILLIFSSSSVKFFSLCFVWIRVCFTFLYTFRVLWGLISINNGSLFRENDSGNLFFSFILVSLGLFAGYNMQINSTTRVFFSLFSEKFLPILILLSVILLFICFNFLHQISPGMFYLDFLVSSLNSVYTKRAKILDFIFLSSLSNLTLNTIKVGSLKRYLFFTSNNLSLLFLLVFMIYFLCCLSFIEYLIEAEKDFQQLLGFYFLSFLLIFYWSLFFWGF